MAMRRMASCVAMIVVAAAMGALMWLSLSAAGWAHQPQRKGLLIIAWMSLAMLCVCLLGLSWLVVGVLTDRFRRKGRAEPTPYVDAWKLSGERFRLDETQDEDKQDG